jgi:hypothetical protein
MRVARIAALVFAVSATMLAAAAPTVASPAAQLPAGLSGGAHPGAWVPAASQPDQCCGMHLHAHLAGSSAYPSAHGSADYQRDCCHREFTVNLRGISSLAGKTVEVWANGTKVGTATVSSSGSLHFHRSGSGVPRLSAGDTVAVKRHSGTLVASGTLKRRCC